ncbi:hypothetical protein B0T16DRAFT_395703 [Cercophora newfieldiana]|uniref:Copper acquisition factor BIM1-like domain-containing protein n=1 Tax=Cercophora newfieldiana TaxID=92897 RepID=A0AA39YNC8_9PEZI|nr:hypothetical protein B0T16DRAFT_395703 [Cercophora newfieldiana]
MKSTTIFGVLLASAQVQAHAVLTYPAWRGNNLLSNESFPFGMARTYPCGGMPLTTNRTFYPLDGSGAFAFEPGWSPGHGLNAVYINLCIGPGEGSDAKEVANCSLTITGPLELKGPHDNQYEGQVCIPRLGLPKGVVPKKGDLASLQVVQIVKHGAALYSCADIIFTDDLAQVPAVNETNCFNSSGLSLKPAKFIADGDAAAAGSGAAAMMQNSGLLSAAFGLMVFAYLL